MRKTITNFIILIAIFLGICCVVDGCSTTTVTTTCSYDYTSCTTTAR